MRDVIRHEQARHSDQVTESSIESLGSRSHPSHEAVGRLGGDEFVALLPEVADERDAERVASRVLDLMREPIIVGGQDWIYWVGLRGVSIVELFDKKFF